VILVFTNRADIHADELIRLASIQNLEVFRINTEDLLSDYLISFNLTADGLATGHIENVVGRRLDLGKRHVAWYRKPSNEFHHPKIDQKFFGIAQAEARATLEILYRWPTIHWVNCPTKSSSAKSKFQQLIFAASNNILVPHTAITNMPANFLAFCKSKDWKIVTKAIYSGNIEIDGLSAAIPTTSVK
jgi:hypothetical protein